MTWMLTITGAVVDLRYMEAATIDILDIAQGLSQINRYTGQASRPYSVAEHSLLVVELLERQAGATNPNALLAALMHDAHEAYFGDMSAPLKQTLDMATGGALRREEQRVQSSVLRKFRLITPFYSSSREIHWADMTALSTEREALMPNQGPTWACTRSYPPVTWKNFEADGDRDWQHWRAAFLMKFAELDAARQAKAIALASAPLSAAADASS